MLLRTASLWLEMLPPSEIAGKTTEAISTVVVQLLIDLLIGVVLTFAGAGAGVAYLGLRLATTAPGSSTLWWASSKRSSTSSAASLLMLIRYKKVAARERMPA